MMKKYLIVLLLTVLLLACGKTGKEEKAPAVPVEVMNISLSMNSNYQKYVGTVEEAFSSLLSFAVPGNVSKVYVQEGDIVEKGTHLAEVDDYTLRSAYDAAAATLSQAEDGYRRMKELHDKGSLPEVQWVEMQTNLEKARSAEQIARNNLENALLTAPFDGLIGKRSVEIGMNMLPGQPAFSLLNMEKVNVVVSIPENVISSLYNGQPAQVIVPAIGNASFQGKVQKKGVVANPVSHTYKINIPIENRKRTLIPGMICNVQIFSDDSTVIMTLPAQAVKLSTNGDHFVWMAEEGRARKRQVQTGPFSSEGITVTEGLLPGEKVIVKGSQKVSEGTLITVQ